MARERLLAIHDGGRHEDEIAMKTVYRGFAYLIAVEVMVQAAAIAYALTGLGKWVQDGGVLNKQVMDSHSAQFQGVGGFPIHGMNGQMVIPMLTLLFLIVSFFTKAPGAIRWALIVLVLVAIQVALGLTMHGIPLLAPLHGINALLLFGAAFMAGHRLRGSRAGVAVAS